MNEAPVDAGVVGVGTMGSHHARVYAELPDTTLVGVADQDETRAESIADDYGTTARSRQTLFERADVVSVAVPTNFHAQVAEEAIDAGTSVLIEKPFVRDPDRGVELCERADGADVTLQVGHIERFNPVVRMLKRILADEVPISFDARRLGPPIDRDPTDGVVLDLMIHDIDVMLTLADSPVTDVAATGAADGQRVSAYIEFESGAFGSLAASRVTQKKVRDISVTTEECHIESDYNDQQIEIHRHSLPEFVDHDGDVRFRHENIIERPMIENREPLKAQLSDFVTSHREGTVPEVTGQDALRALRIARRIRAETS
jgi:predicted dehydrogenase